MIKTEIETNNKMVHITTVPRRKEDPKMRLWIYPGKMYNRKSDLLFFLSLKNMYEILPNA